MFKKQYRYTFRYHFQGENGCNGFGTLDCKLPRKIKSQLDLDGIIEHIKDENKKVQTTLEEVVILSFQLMK